MRSRSAVIHRVSLGLLLLAFCAKPLASSASEELDWANMTMGLLGGLALFLFGMEQMSDALKAAAGDRMKVLLSQLTKNRVSAAFSGAFVTAIIQSSSVTTVLVVGFVSAGLMSMSQSIGIIMGANIGTTITAHIVAFKVTHYALILIAVGFSLLFVAKTYKIRQYGNMLMGLGLIFFGMGIMSDGMSPLRAYQPFISLMTAMEQPILGILVAAGFTALVQSSSATTGLVIVLATQGFINLPTGIAMALGANIGTCITALLASIGKPTEAVRAAVVHVVFNVAGALLWLGFIDQLAYITIWLSPSHSAPSDLARLAAETPRQIANANTLFNVINTIIFLSFAGQLAKLVTWIVPDKKTTGTTLIKPKFLDETLLETPALALHAIRLEIGHMGGFVKQMIDKLRPTAKNNEINVLDGIALIDDKVDLLQQAIFEYLAKIRGQAMSDQEANQFQQLLNITAHLESAGDIIEREIIPLLKRIIETNQKPSDITLELLDDIGLIAGTAMKSAIKAVVNTDELLAEKVVNTKEQLHIAVDKIYNYQSEHIGKVSSKRIALIRLEMELSERLQRLHALSRRIAREMLPVAMAMKSK